MLEILTGFLQAVAALIAAIAGSSILSRRDLSSQETVSSAVEKSNLPAEVKQSALQLLNSRKRLRIASAILIGTSITFLVFALPTLMQLVWSPSLAKAGVVRTLTSIDSTVFCDSRSGDYDIGRLICDRSALTSDTSIASTLNTTKYSFDMFANNAGYVVREHYKSLEDCAKRGVKLRILLNNYGPSNQVSFDAFNSSCGEDLVEVRATSKAMHEMLARLQARFPQQVEIRWTNRVILYTAWMKDTRTSEETFHIGLHFYRGKTHWPSVRFSAHGSPSLAKNLKDDFEFLWTDAVRAPI